MRKCQEKVPCHLINLAALNEPRNATAMIGLGIVPDHGAELSILLLVVHSITYYYWHILQI